MPDFAIVGGGIAGVSLAYYLTEYGADVSLIEERQLGSGMTASSFGGVRQQFSTPLEIELGRRGLKFWKSAETLLEAPCRFHQTGYLMLTANETRLRQLSDAADLQRHMNCDRVEMLGPPEITEIAPWLNGDMFRGGSWTPGDGHVDATDGVAGLARACRDRGVRIVEGERIEAIQRVAGGWLLRGKTDQQFQSIVIAAGLGTPSLVNGLGVELDIKPCRMHYAISGPALDGETVPLTIDLDSGMIVERAGVGVAVSVLASHQSSQTADDMVSEFSQIASARAPKLLDLEIVTILTADFDLTPDGHANAGPIDEGLWVLAGFAGHGIMHGPAIAELLAQQLSGLDPDVDITSLHPLRDVGASTEWMSTRVGEMFGRAHESEATARNQPE